MTDLAWLTEVLKARTSRRLNRVCKRIRKSGADDPGADGSRPYGEPRLGGAARPGPGYGRPHCRNRARKPAA
jgi:hypothetical protein